MRLVTHACAACSELSLSDEEHHLLERLADGCLLERRVLPDPVVFRLRMVGDRKVGTEVAVKVLKSLASAGLLADPMREEEAAVRRRPRGGVWVPVRLTPRGFQCVLCRAHTA